MKRKKRGMTLIEVVASLGMFLIIGVALVGVFSTAFTINAKNRTKAYANANSRAFFELLKSDSYRPKKYEGTEGITPGYYYLSFDNDTGLEGCIKDLKSYRVGNTSTDFESVKGSTSIKAGDKFLMAVHVEWVATDEIYKIDNWSWDIENGSGSEVMRRALIAPK